jgi:hypothetical protein
LHPYPPFLPSEPKIVEAEQTSIAYIHFSSVGYCESVQGSLDKADESVFQAESTLKSVTVNGKRVKVRYEWWNSAPILRVLAKMRSGAR